MTRNDIIRVRVRPILPGQLWWEAEQSCTLRWVERVDSSGAIALVRVACARLCETEFCFDSVESCAKAIRARGEV